MDRPALQDMAPQLPIGALSRRTGCNIETIRYYERIGLLPAPARSEGGHRLYGLGHLKRLGFVRHARDLGFSVEAIRALLKLAEGGDQPCAEARAIASTHLAEVRAKLASLKAMEGALKQMVARCADGAPECPLLESLFEETPAS